MGFSGGGVLHSSPGDVLGFVSWVWLPQLNSLISSGSVFHHPLSLLAQGWEACGLQYGYPGHPAACSPVPARETLQRLGHG